MFKNSELDERAETLLAKMTLSEKIGQMVQVADCNGAIPDDLRQKLREGKIGSMLNVTNPETNREIQRIAKEESRLGIPLIMARDVIHGYRTIFPIPLAQAATWDPQLAEACARVAAREAANAGFQWTFAPMVDIARDPRWGRIAESFGEDPYLASQFSSALVRGFQGTDLSSPHSIAACAKHFVGYGAAEGGRDYDTTNIPENVLRDIYLPPFKVAVDAGVATLMTAFNEINGIPCTGNRGILRDILRHEWGFTGLVVSDWRACAELINHGFCVDLKDAAVKSLHAGVDIEMQSSAYSEYLELLISEDDKFGPLIDSAVKHILKVKFRLGLFDKRDLYSAKTPARPHKKDLDLAKTAALKSIVLLKNKNALLPLPANVKSIAVMGPLAHDPYEVLGTWNRDGCVEDTVTPLAALRASLDQSTEIRYIAGLDHSRSRDTSQFVSAFQLAQESEVILFFAGEESILSGEAHSRAYLNLPGAQESMISEMAKAGKPIVLVILAGRPLVIGEIAEKVDAILYAWHPGTMCGPALVDLIFGEESPSGKLPITFPRAEGQIPVYYAHKNTGRPPDQIDLTMMADIPLRAYQSSLGDAARYLDIGYLPLYPFGFGLSYADFAYSNIRALPERIHVGEIFVISAEVTNTGNVEAEEIVQLYFRDLVGSLTRPVKQLIRFERIRLKPKETRAVVFNLSTDDLGFHDSEMEFIVEPGKFHLWIGGSSLADLRTELQIIS